MQIELPFRTKASLGGVGILTNEDMRDLTLGAIRVYELMKDGRWYGPDEIEMAAGGEVKARAGLRRMRELRTLFDIEKLRVTGRIWRYRLVKKGEL